MGGLDNNRFIKMSIYSGFATRQQQQSYNESIFSIMFILQKRLLKFYRNEPTNDLKFMELLIKIWSNVKIMEEAKYLQPKFSQSVGELVDYVKNKINDIDLPNMMQGIEDHKPDKKSIRLPREGIDSRHKDKDKIIVTERVATCQEQSPIRQNIINRSKKIIYASSINKSANQLSIASNSKKKNIGTELSQETPKLEDKEPFKSFRQSIHKNRKNEGNRVMSSVDSKEDVQQLIKGYLVQKKKNYLRDVERNRSEIEELFKDS